MQNSASRGHFDVCDMAEAIPPHHYPSVAQVDRSIINALCWTGATRYLSNNEQQQ